MPSDPNLLTLFGSILGIVGALLLSIDALGAPDFLVALKEQREKGIHMAQIGFIALINNTFVYLMVSVISFLSILILSNGNVVTSLIIAPFPYFAWIFLSRIIKGSVNYIKRLGPGNYLHGKKGCFGFGIGCIAFAAHFFLWIVPYLILSLGAIIIEFGLDLPLRAIAEFSVAPIVKQIYILSSRVVADEKKWHLKRNALIGSLFVLIGFVYQFIGTLMLIKW